VDPVEQECPTCGGQLKPLGEDVSEQPDIIDAAFKVIRTIRRKKACGRCVCIVQPPAPSRPIERGVAAPGLLARILVAKYADHQPLYRQSATTHARASSWIAPAWLVGWAHAEHWSLHSSMLYVATCSPAARLTPTTRRCRYLPRAMAIPKPHDCGPMCAMTATLDRWIREPSGLPAHPLGRGFTHSHILRACVACCKPTPRPASMRCSRMAT
jgi:transposase